MTEFYDHAKYALRGIGVSSIFGALAGIVVGHYDRDPLFRTVPASVRMCTIVGTACFTLERCANICITQYMFNDIERIGLYNDPRKQFHVKLCSHLISGALVGAQFYSMIFEGKFRGRGASVVAQFMGIYAATDEILSVLLRNKNQVQQQQTQAQQSKPSKDLQNDDEMF